MKNLIPCLVVTLILILPRSSMGQGINSHGSSKAKLEMEHEMEFEGLKMNVAALKKENDSLRLKLESQESHNRAEVELARLEHTAQPERTRDILVPTLVPMSLFFAIAFILWMFISHRNKERLAAIERGLNPEMTKAIFGSHWQERIPSGNTSLRTGLLLMGVGIGGVTGYGFLRPMGDESLGLFLGSFTGGGLGLLIFFFVSHFMLKKSE